MPDVATLTFFSKSEFYRLLVGEDERGKPQFIEFINSQYTTSDPDEIEILMSRFSEVPYEIWPDPDGGSILCPVCYKPFKNDFGLQGHMRSHDKVGDE